MTIVSATKPSSSVALAAYEKHLGQTIAWLDRTLAPDKQGSRAFMWAYGKWSDAYPETTGYIIPTLLDYARLTGKTDAKTTALKLGEWLLSIQDEKGYWHGGTHPAKTPNPSVFNTAQILIGMAALYHETGEDRWKDAGQRGALWLAEGVDDKGEWSQGNYKSDFNPSYYTRVAWPMLEIWNITNDALIREGAERALGSILSRRQDNGVFKGWSFQPDKPAFTHTIAYTIRGFMESARLVNDWQKWGKPSEKALNTLVKKAELANGNLAGAFYEDWSAVKSYTCLTGNAQLAICMLKLYERENDLRLVNAAAKLLDRVCKAQTMTPLYPGAVAGSDPIWGRYMIGRYPNWAAKFHADGLMLLMKALNREGLA